jgi:3-phenylpropionate/trans-cinnamate dioxygenase ferredoxin reductase component
VSRSGRIERWKYLIIGGGLAAHAAIRGIRDVDQAGTILVISDESDPPYNRPPLSKGLWKGVPLASIFLGTEPLNAEFLLGTRIVDIDTDAKIVRDTAGVSFGYEKLLLATGGLPRRIVESDAAVVYYRTLTDFRHTWHLAISGAEFAVIGGGFIGTELAAAFVRNGRKVSLFLPGLCIGERIYPRPLCNFLNIYFRQQGVDVRFNERIEKIERRGSKFLVRSAGSATSAEAVIAGLGIEPNLALAKSAELAVGDGIIVDELLQTSKPDIYAAGDVANFPSRALEMRLRFEHEDNAEAMGRTAGANMAGWRTAYQHLPMFYSDFFDLGYEAVGHIDNRMTTVEDWVDKFHKGVIYYMADSRVRGVLLWNTWGQIEPARELIRSERSYKHEDLMGRLREDRGATQRSLIA